MEVKFDEYIISDDNELLNYDDENYRGKGIGKKLIESIVVSERFKDLFGILGTKDAHELYEEYEFVRDHDRFMSRLPDFLRKN